MIAPARFTITVGVDLSEYADAVLQHALDEAVRHARPALHLATIVPDHHGWWRHPSEAELVEAEDDAKRRLALLAARVIEDVVPPEARRDWRIRLHVRRGRPDEELTMVAAETLSDLLVVGRFGLARGRRGVGSTADAVIAEAECPVLVVGLGRDRSLAADQCRHCVAVRHQSDGEQWFCERHSSDHLGHTTSLGMTGMPAIRGGLMW